MDIASSAFMSKTSGYASAMVVAAVFVTPALAQTPVPDRRPLPPISLQIVVKDHRGTGLDDLEIGGRNPLIVSALAGTACRDAQRAQSSDGGR